MSEYMNVLVLSGIIPVLVSFWPPLRLYHNLKALALTVGTIVLLFGAWDVAATARAHWSFNPRYIWGIHLFNLPLEEVLFFVIIPFCCIFTWEAIVYLKKGHGRVP